jgi:hypothetical protein
MDSPWISLVALAAFLAAIILGMAIRRTVADHHLTTETGDVVHASVAMLVTFSAIVVGLLMNSSKDDFSRADALARNFTVTLVELNDALRESGPAGVEIQKSLAAYTAAVIAATWVAQPPPPGDYYPRNLPRPEGAGLQDSQALSDLLATVGDEINALPTGTRAERQIVARCQMLVARAGEQRLNLVAASQVSLSKPFFVVLVFWLFTAFLCLGLSAPVNLLSITVTTLGAAALSSALFVIVDLSTLFDNGFFSISSTPLRTALSHMLQS